MFWRAVLNLCHLPALLHLDSPVGKRLVGRCRYLAHQRSYSAKCETGTEPKPLP